jgi:hypothetical protein
MSRRNPTVKERALKSIDAELRAELTKRAKAIDEYLSRLKNERRAALAKATEQCRTSKVRAKARAATIRAEAKAQAARVLEAAKTSCAKGKAKAKKRGTKELLAATAERRQATSDRRLLQKTKAPKAPRLRALEQKDEVVQNIAPELIPVWKATKNQFQPHPRKSLTEQFVQWVEENPDEVFALLEPQHDKLVKEAEREQRALTKALRSRKKLAASDWDRIGASPDELSALGLDPDDPDDVLAFVAGYTQHWKDQANGVPF